MKKGVICGADQAQEWLLPWWWSRYKEHNDFPVTFCDFGMSEDARQWCLERGEVLPIDLDPDVITKQEKIDRALAQEWEGCYTSTVWDFRHVWFKKPFALLHSPYDRGIWIDLDCEILQSLESLFDYCNAESQLGIMREFTWMHLPRLHPAIVYNSGVIVFEKSAPIIKKWAEGAIDLNHRFWGDEVLLSYLIREMQVEVFELPGIYNWRLSQGININAAVVHWLGGGGKEFIRNFGGFKPLLDQFYRNCNRI